MRLPGIASLSPGYDPSPGDRFAQPGLRLVARAKQNGPVIPGRWLLLWRRSVAVELLHAFAALLRLERQRRRGARQQARYADRLAGLLAIAVAAIVDHAQRFLDLFEELPLAIARAQLERVLFLERGAVRGIGRNLVLAQMLPGIIGIVEELRAQFDQALPEERELRLAHVLALRRLQQVLIGQFLDLLHDALGRHASTFLKRHKPSLRTRHAATTGPSGQLWSHPTRRQSAARLPQQTAHYISNRSVQATSVTGLAPSAGEVPGACGARIIAQEQRLCMMQTKLTITRPDDWHLHLRDGELMRSVVGATARAFGRAIIMP